MDKDKLKIQLIRHEGRKGFPYMDSVGKLTIGIGHNLTDNGLPPEIVDALYNIDVENAISDCVLHIEFFHELSETRQRVLVDMCFNLGINGLLNFKKFLAALKRSDWKMASIEMADSKWFRQVGQRAYNLQYMILTDRDMLETHKQTIA